MFTTTIEQLARIAAIASIRFPRWWSNSGNRFNGIKESQERRKVDIDNKLLRSCWMYFSLRILCKISRDVWFAMVF